MSIYDAGDINYLVNHFSIPELRKERHQCEVAIAVEEQFDTAKADQARAFLALLNESMDVAVATTPKPKPIPGHVDVEAVKARLDIVSVVERYTPLRKSGKNFIGRCPMHDDRGPSFVVYPDNQSWYCFGACGRGGDVIALVMAIEHLDFKTAVAALGG